MFKRKYLKQLQNVQARIRNCKAALDSLKPPVPDSMKIQNNMYCWLQSLVSGNNPDIDLLYQTNPRGFDIDTLDYIHRLGEYFVGIADHYKAEQQYTMELLQLYKEECRLKDILGID